MFFAKSKDTANVYYVDMDKMLNDHKMVIELWSWHGKPEMLRSTEYTHREMCEQLAEMLAGGYVKRSSDELVGE